MTADDIADVIHSTMPRDLYCKPGAVLASGTNTLTASNVYVMGLNPGGDPKLIPQPLIEMIAPPQGTSNYTHQCWRANCLEFQPCSHLDSGGAVRPEFLVKHQKNMIALAAALGSDPANLFSANAVFARSTSKAQLQEQTGLNLVEWWRACWQVHRRFLAIVRPRLIITLGYGEASSAFGLLRSEANFPSTAPVVGEGRRGGWTFEAPLLLSDRDRLVTRVVGVPHPSYFAPGPLLSAKLAELSR